MKLVTFQDDFVESVGVITDNNEIFNLSSFADIPQTMREILEAGEPAMATIRQKLIAFGESNSNIPLETAMLLPPIPNPKLILSIGLNYWKHLEEMDGTPTPKNPAAFIKSRDTLLGSGMPLTKPKQCSDMIDYEGELCVVIGKTCHNVETHQAMDYVAGYTIANDISARDWVAEVFSSKETFEAVHAWERNINGKQLPGFTPCGPVIVLKDEISDPQCLQLETRLNGQTMQSTSTSDMIFSIEEIIAYYSKWYRFNPGDIITTGTPAGVGFGRDPQFFMKTGDIIEVEIEKIGILCNDVL